MQNAKLIPNFYITKKRTHSFCCAFVFVLVVYVRQKCNLSCALDRSVDLALMLCACTGNSSGKDLTSLRDEFAKTLYVLVVNVLDLLRAENTNFLSLAVGTEATCVIRCSIHFLFLLFVF